MGEVRPFLHLLPVAHLLLAPPHCFLFQCGASTGLGGRTPYPVSGHAQRVCAPARGVPPPSPPYLGVPPPPYSAFHARGADADRGVTPLLPSLGGVSTYLPLLQAVRGSRVLLGGWPPFPLWFRWSPPIPLLHTVHMVRMLRFGGVTCFLLYLAARSPRNQPGGRGGGGPPRT